MFASIRRTMRELKRSTGGNAAMLVALGMPALIGSAGLAVDVSQWYMWQRELQFAADQAALAGAWARSSTATQSEYVTRARQEFAANLATTNGGTSTPAVSMSSYNGGTDNAVLVTATASKPLPFTKFITGGNATVAVSAMATFSISHSYTACILSVNPSQNKSAIFGNAITGGTNCGVGALSTGTQAIIETGDSEVALGDIISAGGIEDTFSNNGTIHEFVTGLSNPYSGLTEPSPAGQPARAYDCPTPRAATTTWTAPVTVRTQTTYLYKKGNSNNGSPITLSSGDAGYAAPVDTTTGPTTRTSYTALTSGTEVNGPTTGSYVQVAGQGNNRIWRAAVTTITTTTGTVTGPITTGGNDGIARPQPGVYSDINIACPTQFSSGIYWISGSIDFGQNMQVTGSDVLFVMTGSNGNIRTNSNSQLTISGISASTLQTRYGYSADEAAKLKNMLFFDKNSSNDFDINGNASIDLAGVLYMPARSVKINGNMSSGQRCIMLVSDTFWITGSANLTNFCAPDNSGGMQLGERTATVRLVA
mgnify:CR=1 FL=1